MTARLDNIQAQLALLTKMVNDLAQRVAAADGGPVEVRHGGCVPETLFGDFEDVGPWLGVNRGMTHEARH